ncbi:hypothetical protein KVR01_000883 [Diaporthe batatas]|uniref:uncharacterized protein n=1 Tax=Diaporthe batatas TaxID=748121 RepID=UPI001D038F15|nr:uncharacterized protein KVR01_000883 [Diaporthe batatas]KAG8170138.1 hypothetical protein KVR01_000883 [Diaporthe batatas]
MHRLCAADPTLYEAQQRIYPSRGICYSSTSAMYVDSVCLGAHDETRTVIPGPWLGINTLQSERRPPSDLTDRLTRCLTLPCYLYITSIDHNTNEHIYCEFFPTVPHHRPKPNQPNTIFRPSPFPSSQQFKIRLANHNLREQHNTTTPQANQTHLQPPPSQKCQTDPAPHPSRPSRASSSPPRRAAAAARPSASSATATSAAASRSRAPSCEAHRTNSTTRWEGGKMISSGAMLWTDTKAKSRSNLEVVVGRRIPWVGG